MCRSWVGNLTASSVDDILNDVDNENYGMFSSCYAEFSTKCSWWSQWALLLKYSFICHSVTLSFCLPVYTPVCLSVCHSVAVSLLTVLSNWVSVLVHLCISELAHQESEDRVLLTLTWRTKTHTHSLLQFLICRVTPRYRCLFPIFHWFVSMKNACYIKAGVIS